MQAFTTNARAESLIDGARDITTGSFGLGHLNDFYQHQPSREQFMKDEAKKQLASAFATQFGFSPKIAKAFVDKKIGNYEQKKSDKEERIQAINSTVQTAVITAVSMGALSFLGPAGNAISNVTNTITNTVGNALSSAGTWVAENVLSHIPFSSSIGNWITGGVSNLPSMPNLSTMSGTTAENALNAKAANLIFKTVDGSKNGPKGALVGFFNGVLNMSASSQSSLSISMTETGKKNPWDINYKKKFGFGVSASKGNFTLNVDGKGSTSMGYNFGNTGSVNVNLTNKTVGGNLNFGSFLSPEMKLPPGVNPSLFFQSKSFRKDADNVSLDPFNQKPDNKNVVGLDVKVTLPRIAPPGEGKDIDPLLGITPQLGFRMGSDGKYNSSLSINGTNIISTNNSGTFMNNNILSDYVNNTLEQQIRTENDQALADAINKKKKGQTEEIAALIGKERTKEIAAKLGLSDDLDSLTPKQISALNKELIQEAVNTGKMPPTDDEASGWSKNKDDSLWTKFVGDANDAWQILQGSNVDDDGWVDANGVYHQRTCFVAGTLISTKNGFKKIEDIQVGDVVLSKDEASGKIVYKKVTELYYHEVDTLFEIRLSNGEIIETTWNHPFYIENRGWTEAKDILAGNKLITSTGIIEVESNKEKYVSSVGVYNFEVENTHSYFVGENRVWVHNYDPKDFYLQDELKLPIKNQKLNPIEQPFNNIDEFIIDELKNQGKLLTEENKQKLLIKIALGNGNRNVDDFRNSLKEGTLDIFSSLINYYDRQIDTENNKRSAYISNEGRSLTFYEKKLLSLIYGKRLNTDVIKIKPSTEQSFFKREITNLYLKATNRKKEDVMYTEGNIVYVYEGRFKKNGDYGFGDTETIIHEGWHIYSNQNSETGTLSEWNSIKRKYMAFKNLGYYYDHVQQIKANQYFYPDKENKFKKLSEEAQAEYFRSLYNSSTSLRYNSVNKNSRKDNFHTYLQYINYLNNARNPK